MIYPRRSLSLLAILGLAALACDGPVDVPLGPDPGPDPAPGPRGDVSLAMTCTADLASEKMSCEGGDTKPEGISGTYVTFGGQGEFVQLTSSGTTFDGVSLFETNVTLQNLIPQPMGTSDANSCTGGASAVFIFFHSGPSNGVVVANPDGTGTFTDSNQPFFQYDPPIHFTSETGNWCLDPNETSSAKNWEFDTSGMPEGVTTFTFSVFVDSEVPYPDGFVDVTPDPAGIETNGTRQLTATVRDVVGREVTGRTITWSESDASLATVDNTGLVSAGSTNRGTNVFAASDGAESTDTVLVAVSEPLTDATALTISDGAGGELFYKFTVPGGGALRAPSAAAAPERLDADPRPPARAARAWGIGSSRATADVGADGRQLSASLQSSQLFPSHVASLLAVAIDSTDGTSATSGEGADLYVRAAGPPRTDLWDCRPFFSTHNEACAFDDPAAGSDWWIMVRGGEAYSDVLVVADHETSDAGYTIDLDIRDSFTADQLTAIQRGADRWAEVITGDLRIVEAMNVACGAETEVVDVNRAADDLVVVVVQEVNDGAGGVLASAGPCTLRSSAEDLNVPLVGIVSIDSDDLVSGSTADTAILRRVVTHELGHTMGLPPLWSTYGLLSGSGTSDPRYTGTEGVAAWQSLGGTGDVPVQPTVEAHWDEAELDDELMTPISEGGAPEPLSTITIEQFEDVGYAVDPSAADPYSLPSGGSLLAPAAAFSYGDDLLHGPVTVFDPATGQVRVFEYAPYGRPVR